MTRPKNLAIEEAKPEQWFAVCDRATGVAVSFGTVIADPLPEHLEAVAITAQPSKSERTRWDPVTKSVVELPSPPPPRDVVAELLDDPVVAAIVEKLTKVEAAAFDEKLRAMLG